MVTNRRKALSRKNQPKTFEEYIAEEGKDLKGALATEKAEARAELERDSTNTGALGTKLKGSGLSGGGYEDYMRSRAEISAKERIDAAKHESELKRLSNRTGYAKYLSEHEELQNKLADSMIDKLSVEAAPDYETMLDKFLSAGLTEERAVIAASTAYEKAADNAVYRAIAFAKSNSLTPYRAKQYAISIGLGEDLADRVYEAAFTLSQDTELNYQNLSAEEFNDYITKRGEAYMNYRVGKELERKIIKERTNNYYEG
jgi:hypothetical protein